MHAAVDVSLQDRDDALSKIIAPDTLIPEAVQLVGDVVPQHLADIGWKRRLGLRSRRLRSRRASAGV
jgi:hypothetical protein